MSPDPCQHVFSCVAIVFPGESAPGKWVAHCLTFDVFAQANDPELALNQVVAATLEACVDDLCEGRDPHDRKAPPEDWALFNRAMSLGQRMTVDDARREPRTKDGRVAVMLASFAFTCDIKVEETAPLSHFTQSAMPVGTSFARA